MNDSIEKLNEYFDVIEKHVFKPIETTDLSKSCYATIIMLFSVIDGLGKLVHPDRNASSAGRFKFFLNYLGKDYNDDKDNLWDLRNSLIHNGINNISYMSATSKGETEHLKSSTDTRHIFISSSKLTQHLKDAVAKLKDELLNSEETMKEPASRLEWNEDNPSDYWSPFSTPPGIVRFIKLK